MKSLKGSIAASVDGQPSIRFDLFHGPDEAQSNALGDRLVCALKASKYAVAGGALRGDPALLADEAGAIDMFGGAKVIWVQPAGEEIRPVVRNTTGRVRTESPVVAVAGRLGKTSGRLDPSACARPLAHFLRWMLHAERLVRLHLHDEGLRIQTGVASRIAEACDSDRRMMASELTNLFLIVVAEFAEDLGSEVLNALGTDMGGDFLGIGDLCRRGRSGSG